MTQRLGEEIAKIQRLQPSPSLAFFKRPAGHPARTSSPRRAPFSMSTTPPIQRSNGGLRGSRRMYRTAKAGVMTARVRARDFRTGNLMVDEHGLVAVLDWEFAAWSHPLEDLGWLCAHCWRFGRREETGRGGLGSREDLLTGYNRIAGRNVLPAQLSYWEVLGEVRWALIAIAQAERHVSGREPSLELALTGHIVPQLELQILRMTGNRFRGAARPEPPMRDRPEGLSLLQIAAATYANNLARPAGGQEVRRLDGPRGPVDRGKTAHAQQAPSKPSATYSRCS